MSSRTILVLLIAVFAAFARADVPHLRNRLFAARAQRQQLANPTPYPAAGFRPDRQFSLPQDQFAQNAPESNVLPADQQTLQRPDKLYGAPAAQNFLPQQQPQITYGAPVESPQPEAAPAPAPEVVESQRLTAKSARLTNNREDQEEEDESRTDIEVETNVEEKKATAAQPAAPAPTATFVYYPAGAVGFVQPAQAAAAAYSLPAQAPLFAKVQAQPAAFAAPQPQQFFAQPQFLQPQAAAYFSAQLRAW